MVGYAIESLKGKWVGRPRGVLKCKVHPEKQRRACLCTSWRGREGGGGGQEICMFPTALLGKE